ncbi:hypothetical protein SRHO_G00124500 [Serrasalmus rhombeus]
MVMEQRVEDRAGLVLCIQTGYEMLALVTQDFCSILLPLFGIDRLIAFCRVAPQTAVNFARIPPEVLVSCCRLTEQEGQGSTVFENTYKTPRSGCHQSKTPALPGRMLAAHTKVKDMIWHL